MKFILILLFSYLFFSCKKAQISPSVSQLFFISFSTSSKDYLYQTGTNYQFLRDGSLFTGPGGFGISPATEISPLPTNQNIHNVGFVFGYSSPSNFNFEIPWSNIGDTIFKIGSKKYCEYGVGYSENLGPLSCYDYSKVSFFWLKSDSVHYSGTGYQPSESFFNLDTVLNFHHEDVDLTSKIYDKIISGTFQCRIFDPNNSSKYEDITNGKFRMPVWRNAHD